MSRFTDAYVLQLINETPYTRAYYRLLIGEINARFAVDTIKSNLIAGSPSRIHDFPQFVLILQDLVTRYVPPEMYGATESSDATWEMMLTMREDEDSLHFDYH